MKLTGVIIIILIIIIIEIRITTENSHIGHCTHTSESANVKVQ
jgi:succinate dehydrogenase hydrophobic anchor subunit